MVSPLQLNYKTQGQTVVITPENEDRFSLTVQEAIRACSAGQDAIIFDRQFKKLLEKTTFWLKKNSSDIDKAYVTIRDSDILFFIVRKTVEYNRDFEDVLTDFDIEVAEDRNLDKIRMSVLAIPKSSPQTITSFLRPDFAWIYNAR
jgi:hypothetical protein